MYSLFRFILFILFTTFFIFSCGKKGPPTLKEDRKESYLNSTMDPRTEGVEQLDRQGGEWFIARL